MEDSNKLEYYYGYDSDKKLSRTDYKSNFESWKKEGNYELVYQSGKFKEK